MNELPFIGADAPPETFPPVEQALRKPDGLLAVGGDLSPERLLAAYRRGIFPWFDDRTPILWWSPDPRMVLETGRMYRSRRLRRTLRRGHYRVTMDQAFDAVVTACADVSLRPDQNATWITPEMADAYGHLHRMGHAHSLEVWQGRRLVGGIYGLALGRIFFGESMFHRINDGSKIALAWLDAELAARDFLLLDCQVESPHLARLGAQPMPRRRFTNLVERHARTDAPPAPWTLGVDRDMAASPQPRPERATG